MTQAWVGIGSNVAPERHVRLAVSDLREQFGDLRLSRVYRSPAVGFEGPDFLNLVAGFETTLSAAAVATALRTIEDRHGRMRGPERFCSRTLDLDLLLFGSDRDLELGLPAADIDRYAFVLRPLADAFPDGRHPVSGESFQDLWRRIADRLAGPPEPVPFEFA